MKFKYILAVTAILISILFLFTCCSTADSKQPLIIFTDCGVEVDDQWMLVHLAGLEQFRIEAVVSSHFGGFRPDLEAESEYSKTAVEELFEIIDRSDISVCRGRERRLSEPVSLEVDTSVIINNIISKLPHDQKAVVVISGPATDLADAILCYPEIAARIEVYATAFYSRDIGSSFNVHNDPFAWQVLLNSDVEITVAINPVSMNSFLVTKDRVEDITASNTDVAVFLRREYNLWLSENEDIVMQITGSSDSWPIWDEILPAYLSGYCEIEVTQRPVLLDDGSLSYKSQDDGRLINWITACDSARSWNDFIGIISR